MKKVLIILFFLQIAMIHSGQIIADHTVVDKYDIIPQQFIDEVKKMLVIVKFVYIMIETGDTIFKRKILYIDLNAVP